MTSLPPRPRHVQPASTYGEDLRSASGQMGLAHTLHAHRLVLEFGLSLN